MTDYQNANLKPCKHCGQMMAKSAKVCPNCGGKNKPPIYKRPWFIILAVLIVIGAFGSSGGSKSKSDNKSSSVSETASTTNTTATEKKEEKIEYTHYDVSEMVDDLNSNAMKAQNKYKGQYIEITGKLAVIDSNGKYISLYGTQDDLSFTGVQCYLKTDEQKEQVMEMSIGDIVTLRGKCKDVGEILGFTLDIDSID